VPSGGWTVAYADGFGASLGIGAGQDNTWKLDQRDQGCCSNGNEINAERPEMVSVGSEGLNLRCERREVVSKPYVCGGISGYSGTDPSGYRTPKIEFKGQTLALEFIAKLPPAHGIADPGMWMDGSPWTDVEFDGPEAWGYGSGCKVGWDGCSMGFIWFSPPHPEIRIPTSNALAERLHKYTTRVWPTGSGRYRYSVYLDGALKGTSPEVTADTITKDDLILTYALRQATGQERSGFSGSNSFIVRSVAVYIDGSHGGVVNGGIAPGTTVGSEPSPEPEAKPEPEANPEPSGKPAAPTGVTATSTSTSTSPGIAIKWVAVSGATSYKLYRAGNENIEGRKPGQQWGPATMGTQLPNHLLVTIGGWYCYRVSAINANGQGPFGEPACATA
jgi:hypothetical protein